MLFLNLLYLWLVSLKLGLFNNIPVSFGKRKKLQLTNVLVQILWALTKILCFSTNNNINHCLCLQVPAVLSATLWVCA